MMKEVKISLPFYKAASALLFIVILSLIRGVSVSCEIGTAMEPALAILVSAFCADTYVLEITGRRSEVWRLYPMKHKLCSLGARLLIQQGFLLLLAAAGYCLFFLFQRPRLSSLMQPEAGSEIRQFLIFLGAMAVTIAFWSVLSNTIACIFRSLWFGIGGCLLLWLLATSSLARKLLDTRNVFSYTYRNIADAGDFGWLAGKGLCIALCVVMLLLLQALIKKRGYYSKKSYFQSEKR